MRPTTLPLTSRQAGRQAGGWAGTQAGRQAGTHTGRQTHTCREGKRGREGEKQSDTQTDRTQSWCYAHAWQEAGSIDGAIDFFRAYELDPAFECLMDHPSVYLSRTKVRVQLSVSLYVSSSCINVNGDRYPILATALQSGRGGEPGEPRLRDPVVQYMPGHTQGAQWHRDGFNIRLTYILDDLEEDGGGTAWCAFASRTCLAAHCRLHLPVDRLTWQRDAFVHTVSRRRIWINCEIKNSTCHCHRGSRPIRWAHQRTHPSTRNQGVSSHHSLGCQLAPA
jgi:hypothetical protein